MPFFLTCQWTSWELIGDHWRSRPMSFENVWICVPPSAHQSFDLSRLPLPWPSCYSADAQSNSGLKTKRIETMQWYTMGWNGGQWTSMDHNCKIIQKYPKYIWKYYINLCQSKWSKISNSNKSQNYPNDPNDLLISVEHSPEFAVHVSSCHMNHTESRSIHNSSRSPTLSHNLLPR